MKKVKQEAAETVVNAAPIEVFFRGKSEKILLLDVEFAGCII